MNFLFPPSELFKETGGGCWKVQSASDPLLWHVVDAAGTCDCKGFANRRRCRHVTLLRQSGIDVPYPPVDDFEANVVEHRDIVAASQFPIWTSRFQRKDLVTLGLIPVRTTLGGPRFKLGYDLEENIPQIAPTFEMFKMGDAAFRVAYRKKIASYGVEFYQKVFDDIRNRHEQRPIALLCFEDVFKGEHCHRRDFADWWLEMTGEIIPELS